ncbi:MAG: hypothetical protein IPH94_13150 [Saprospiraceae bacterium]|nr:hypothetical protein [Saprospiraceae bacterium]
MKTWKWLFILSVLFTLGNTIVDVQYWQNGLPFQDNGLSKIFRFGRTLIIATMAGILYYHQSHLKNVRLLLYAFLLTVVADGFLILANLLQIGMLFFIIVQVLLILRHAPPLDQLKKNKVKVLYAFLTGTILYTIIYTLIGKNPIDLPIKDPILKYAFVLVVSLISAQLAELRPEFTRSQSQKIFWGMVFFFLCDLTVVLPLLFSENELALLARALTGLLYTPALLLLVLSAKKENN